MSSGGGGSSSSRLAPVVLNVFTKLPHANTSTLDTTTTAPLQLVTAAAAIYDHGDCYCQWKPEHSSRSCLLPVLWLI